MPRSFHVVALGIALALQTAAAHHSHGNYQMTEYIQLAGTVTEIHWINPHSWIYLEVPDPSGGPGAVWALEGASVAGLRRAGWAEDSIAVGDAIAVRCHQLKDRSNGCLLGYVAVEGGQERLFD